MEASDGDGSPPSKRLKKTHSDTSSSVYDLIKKLCKNLLSRNPVIKQSALQRLRETISNNRQIPIDVLIRNKIVSVLAELLEATNLDIRHNAAKILAYMTTGTPEQTLGVISTHMLQILMGYVESLNFDVCKDALEIITNVVAAGPLFRDFCLHLGIIDKLLNAPPDVLFDITKMMIFICQNPCPNHDVIHPFLIKMVKCIQHEDDAIRANCMIIFFVITKNGSKETKDFVIKRFIPLLLRLFYDPNTQIRKDILLIFQNVVSDNNLCIETLIKTEVITGLIKFLTPGNKQLLKLAFESLGNFMSFGLKACEHCVQCGILETLSSLTVDLEPDILLAKATVIRILCQNYCIHLLPESATILVQYLFALIFNSNNDIVVCALDSISYFNSDHTKDVLIPKHVCDRFTQLFNHMEKNVQVAANIAFGNIIKSSPLQTQPQTYCNVDEVMDVFMQHDDPSALEPAIKFLLEDNTNVNIPVNVLSKLVKLLDAKSFKLQLLAANLLEKISGGTKEQIDAILLLNPDVPLIRILKSNIIDVRVAALGFLGNIMESYLNGRVNSNLLKIANSLLNLLHMTLSRNVIQHFGKILFRIFRDPLPEQIVVSAFFPCLLKFIQNSINTNFIINLLTALSNATKEMPAAILFLIEEKMVTRLVDLLKHDDVNVQQSALMVLDVISGQQKQHLIDCYILKEIKKLFLEYSKESINANGLLLLSKIANGGEKEIQAIFEEENLVSIIFHFFKNEKLQLQKEAASVFLCFINGNMEQVMKLMDMGFLPLWFDFMAKCDAISVIPLFKAFYEMCKKAETYLIEIRQQIISNGGTSLFRHWLQNGDEELRVIIYECMNFLGFNLSPSPINLSLLDF